MAETGIHTETQTQTQTQTQPWQTGLQALLMLALLSGLPARAATQEPDLPQPDVQRYDCVGEVKSENIFLPGSATLTPQRFALTLNLAGNYLKRDATLAAGCLMPRIEICQCDLTPELVTCRSFGLNPRNGDEVSADFTLARASGLLQFQARQSSPAAGEIIEKQGQLICTEVRPARQSGSLAP